MLSGSDKMSLAARVVTSSKYVQCGEMEESSEHAFFYCPVVRLLCASLLKATQFACCTDNSLPSMAVLFVATRAHCRTGERTVFASRDENGDIDDQDERNSRDVVSSHHLVASVKHQLKAKIKVERERLYSEDLLKRGWL